MSTSTKIEWTEATWNPVTGCTKLSAGCTNCYACALAKRLKAMGNPRYINGFNVTLHNDLIDLPLKWRKPKRVFVNSMSDLFHEDVPFEFIQQVFNTMERAYWHQFQILTKRSARLAELAPILRWPRNVWQGVTVEDRDNLYRMDHLRNIPASIKFVSFEPLIGSIGQVNLEGIDWVIVGGESGPKCRPILKEWVREIREQCINSNTPFFFKQWGGINKHKNGSILDNQEWKQYPNNHIPAYEQAQLQIG